MIKRIKKYINTSIVLSNSKADIQFESMLMSFFFMFFALFLFEPDILSNSTKDHWFIYSVFYAISFGLSYYLVTLIFRSTSNEHVYVSLNIYVVYFFILCAVCGVLCFSCHFLIDYYFIKLDSKKTAIKISYLSWLFVRVFEVILFFQIPFVAFNLYSVKNNSNTGKTNSEGDVNQECILNVVDDLPIDTAVTYCDIDLTVVGLNKNEVVTFNSSDFIYAKSEGHYIKIFYLCANTNIDRPLVKSILFRKSMKSMEDVLLKVSYIFRGHNSYFVNLKKVKCYRTNDKGAILVLNVLTIEVPVSKKNVNRIKSYLTLNHDNVIIYN